MDSITQFVLGSAVAYAIGGKKLGKKALIFGGIAATIPDLDSLVIAPFNDDLAYLEHHRGFSHSLLFALTSPLWSFLTKPLFKHYSRKLITKIFFWCFLTHSILDAFTMWGTQLLWPIPIRVAWNSIFIIDLFYTLPLLITVIWAGFSKLHIKRQKLITTGLILSSIYLSWTVAAKLYLQPKFETLFKNHRIPIERFSTRPTAFNSILWTAIAETKDGFYIAYVSLFDKKLESPSLFIPKNQIIPKQFDTPYIKKLQHITNNYYITQITDTSVIVKDLRFGAQKIDKHSEPNFVFSYEVHQTNSGKLQTKIQRSSTENSKKRVAYIWKRLKGI